MSIYKPCDIRGQVGSQLTPQLYQSWGCTLGQQVKPRAKFVVGGDVRASTPAFLSALADGLCQSGTNVVDLDILPTPMIYYAKRRLRAAGCAIVTASRNPAEINGLKWLIGDHPPTPDDVAALRRGAENPSPDPPDRSRGTRRPLDISFDYVAWLQETWVDGLELEQHLVLDPMHGCWASRARRYLQAIFPRCLFSAIHDTPHAALADRSPDCSRPELLEELADAVYHQRAHLGIAFDGDGDQVAFVDNEGTALTAEEATCILLQSFAGETAGLPFVYDLKFSQRLPETARSLGAEPIAERSGHAFIRSRMLQSKAFFGAEISGHYFFRALDGGDDGLFTACWMIAWLAHCAKTLAELRRACPAVFMTPDLRVQVQPPDQQSVIQRVRAAWSQYPQTALDGVRIDFPDGWALVRSSVTESSLTFRFEAADWSSLRDLVWRFCDTLDELGDHLWFQYAAALGSEDGLG